MDFKTYDPNFHAEKLSDWFRYKASKPEDVDDYREAVSEAYEDFKDYFGLDRDVRFVFAETDIDAIREKYDEIPVWEYAMGFSSDPKYHDVEKPTVFLMATDDYDYWRNILKFTAAHELAHQKFYEEREVKWRIYQRMLFEGHAMHSAEELSSKNNYNWNQEGWEAEEVDPEDLIGELDKFNKWKNQEDVEVSTLFEPDGEKWQNAEGYPITFQVTRLILEEDNLNVDDLLEIGYREWKERVEKSIRKLYS